MTSPSARVALTVWVLIGSAAGCASRTSPPPPHKPTITAADIERSPGPTIEQVLQSKAPGVIVRRTDDGGITVQIRGPSSFMSSGEPLYVIDDVPMRPGPGGALTGVNPYDIESIEVLKNPADIAIYGVRGANGVIVVKTKQAKRRSSFSP